MVTHISQKESISKEDVKRLASLARIQTTSAEEEKLAGDMKHILSYVRQIQTVSGDAAANKGTASKAPKNVLREDNQPHASGAFSEDLLAAAPSRQGQFVKVKNIL